MLSTVNEHDRVVIHDAENFWSMRRSLMLQSFLISGNSPKMHINSTDHVEPVFIATVCIDRYAAPNYTVL